MSAAAAAPALVLGPPGWVIFAFAVVATAVVGAVAISQSHPRARSEPRSETKTGDMTIEDCPRRPWSVRVHAQGTDIGGTTGSTLGAPRIIQTGGPITVAQGVGLAGATFALLTARQSKNLAAAYEKCTIFISRCPPLGFLGKKSFYGRSHDNNRFDLDSFGPSPNLVS